MKKIVLATALLMTFVVISCKNSEENAENGMENAPKLLDSGYRAYSGEFFYSEDGSVLKGDTFIYAVTLDDLAKELGQKIAPIKKEEYDMVPVVVKGEVTRNPALDEGKQVWEEIITIKEIVAVGNAPADADIKIEEKKS
ncbi:MAG TPA: hypothetical protein PKW08_04380 [Flavobacteriaceae bacterium]|nr:hypothetical protein [Flavobacteriaceae bacterium]MCB9212706.1 hypothetical protein [Alteromonas sp.]HPF11779.1 hypothetical protein [Flavobacteriaceae bacterium]HQU20805.1 hypothetical protein [Flavobacteriaceae bacterium]HQU64980.1 hypothetical protein [Flavobacteriaceae bacterium]